MDLRGSAQRTAIAIALSSSFVFGYTIKVEDYENEVKFVAKTNALFKVKGEIKGVARGIITGEYRYLKGHVIVDVTKFETGLSLRDKHLKEVLEATRFPTSSLRFKTDGKDSFTGHLTFHNVTKPISGIFETSPIRLEFNIHLPDFGIRPPSFMGVTVLDDVKCVTMVSPVS